MNNCEYITQAVVDSWQGVDLQQSYLKKLACYEMLGRVLDDLGSGMEASGKLFHEIFLSFLSSIYSIFLVKIFYFPRIY